MTQDIHATRIDNLIQQHCPNGVKRVPLCDLLEYEQPGKYLVASTDYDDSFRTPVLTAGKTFVLGYTDEEHGIYGASPNSPVLIFDDFTTAFRWVDFPFKAKSSAMKFLTLKPSAGASLRYVFFAMQTIDYAPQDHSRHWIGTYSKFTIPLPPLPVQEEIVRILDTFTQLEAELEAELEARKQQYEHYRKMLLSSAAEVEWSTLGEVSTRVSSGGTPRAGQASFYAGGTIPWLRTNEVRFNEIWDTEIKITEDAVEQSSAKWIPENSVIVAISGATAGRSAINKIPMTTNQHCCNLEIDAAIAHYRYVFHWVGANYEQLKSLGRGVRSDLNSRIIKDFAIPVPSLAEQERIIAVLDQFDALTNDLSVGLPAEIRARRQQYEFYRDRLLSFEEVQA